MGRWAANSSVVLALPCMITVPALFFKVFGLYPKRELHGLPSPDLTCFTSFPHLYLWPHLLDHLLVYPLCLCVHGFVCCNACFNVRLHRLFRYVCVCVCLCVLTPRWATLVKVTLLFMVALYYGCHWLLENPLNSIASGLNIFQSIV